MRVFRDISEWLRECRSLPAQDLDNVILLTGAEGAGKSTLAAQLAFALDPELDMEAQIGFDIKGYIRKARKTAKGKAVWCDEFLANKRKAMHGGTIELLDFLQECRGLNLHHVICFPHFDLLDKAVRDHRVRWHVHIPKRGLFQLREKFKYFAPGGVEQWGWRIVGSWNYGPNKGPVWERYLAMKADHMTKRGEDAEEGSFGGYDLAVLATFPGKYEDACGKLLASRKLA